MEQQIRFCAAPDKTNIAYATVGTGPPLVKAANWMNHLEFDWRSPVWNHLMYEFAQDFRLVRYDERGTGLSDRDVSDLSLDSFVGDLEAVVDALKLERFPLFAISQGGPVAITYAHRHPERVSHLILHGSFAVGWRKADLAPEALAHREAQVVLIKQGWNSRNPAIRQLWTSLCIPDSTPEEAHSFNELQQASVSPENAASILEAIGEFDVREILPDLDVPTLVSHSRNDALVPFEEGRRMAALIPNAKFLSLESSNHLVLSHEPAWGVFLEEIREFLGCPERAAASSPTLKECPSCSRAYTDPTLNYCLDDGSPLSAVNDGEATRILN